MMSVRKFLACFTFSLLCSTLAVAQEKRAEEADATFKAGRYFNAIELYKVAYTKEDKASAKAELIFKVGECYRALGDAPNAQMWYEKANKAGYTDPITYYYIGEALKEQGKYAEAISAFNKYKEKNPGSMQADAAVASCQLAQTWKDQPSRYIADPEVLLNTPQYDISAAFSTKNNDEVVFASGRPASTGTETDGIAGESFLDLFASSRDKLGRWSEPVKLPPTINTSAHEGAPTFNAKRTVMYFTRCQHEKKKAFGCEIWMSRKVGSNYSEPEMLDLGVKSPEKDTFQINRGQPAVSKDDGTLIFSSNQKGGLGGKDLWMVRLDKDGKPTGMPTNLGPEINTKEDDKFPFLRANGDLYFSSDGHMGMGGFDIFMAEKTGDNTWGHVENLKSPINSSGDDLAIIFDGDEEKGYFTSNRPGGKGQDDIWRFMMPNLVFALQGTCYDKLTGQPLPDTKVEVVGTDGSNFSALTVGNGGFVFAEKDKDRYIKENTSYTIRASKESYLVVNDQITTADLNESTTFAKEYYLQPVIGVTGIPLPQVLYEVDRFELTQAGKDSLEILFTTLTENPTIIIELRSHTDSRSTHSYRGGNMELSQKRAQSCVNYLVTKGIDPVRMVPVGKGGAEPLITDGAINAMKTKEEQEAAHHKNRRTDFKVIGFDYVPKEGIPTLNQ
jgi:peptidoglycan-associated lipoprotein